jgi:glycosyltransferase involved in cell wall biosynthesis
MSETLKINTQVTFHEKKIGQEKEDIIIKSDIFVHTSRWEGMPLSILEAAGLGLPLLISKQTNLADYVYKSGAGFVINELTPKNISDMLLVVFKEKINRQLDNKGKAARKMAVDEFSWEDSVKLFYKNIYTKKI